MQTLFSMVSLLSSPPLRVSRHFVAVLDYAVLYIFLTVPDWGACHICFTCDYGVFLLPCFFKKIRSKWVILIVKWGQFVHTDGEASRGLLSGELKNV
jgi:hypothetical protein